MGEVPAATKSLYGPKPIADGVKVLPGETFLSAVDDDLMCQDHFLDDPKPSLILHRTQLLDRIPMLFIFQLVTLQNIDVFLSNSVEEG